MGAGRVHQQSAFLFQVPLKPTLLHGRAGPGGSHPIMNCMGRGMGSSQPGEGGLPHPQTTHEPQTFLLLICLTLNIAHLNCV
jgi:hypothetical protein